MSTLPSKLLIDDQDISKVTEEEYNKWRVEFLEKLTFSEIEKNHEETLQKLGIQDEEAFNSWREQICTPSISTTSPELEPNKGEAKQL